MLMLARSFTDYLEDTLVPWGFRKYIQVWEGGVMERYMSALLYGRPALLGDRGD